MLFYVTKRRRKKQSYNNNNWAFYIKSILEISGLGNVWQIQDTISQQETNYFLKIIEIRL